MEDPIFSVKDKICLVTGASTGIGGHLSRVLLNRGAIVIGFGLNEIDWDTSHINYRFDYLSGDLRDEMMVDKIYKYLRDKFGRIDIVVNCAGISQIERSTDFSSGTLKDIFDINVICAAIIASRGAKLMRDTGTGGSIINVTSVMANSAMMSLSAYSSTKAALDQLTRAMASEWARYNIRVNNLAPGWFPTAMTNGYLEKGMADVLKTRIPAGRLGVTTDLDGAFLLLASDASKYMTGATLTVDGGFSIIN